MGQVGAMIKEHHFCSEKQKEVLLGLGGQYLAAESVHGQDAVVQ